jgi:hypothetical protein
VRKTERSRGEVADIIERFVDGICGKWDWDDFISWPIVDPHLDAIRTRCAGMSQEFPTAEKRHYCNEAGMEVLRQMVRELRQPKIPN